MKTTIAKNLSILLIFGLIVKILGLFNKIILSRVLLIEGLAYYTKLIPIASLFMVLASFSLGPVITQIVSKNISKRPYSNRDLMEKGFKTATITASIVSLIHLILNYVICTYLLQMTILIKPFLLFIPLYYLQSYSAILKGYFHGHNRMQTYAIGQLLEQIIRIVLVYIFIIPQMRISIINGVMAAILTLSIGELIQTLYMVICALFITKLKGKKTIKTEYKEIIKPALNLTTNKLISSIGTFLEPIIYTFAFLKTGLSIGIADEFYAVVHGYAIPLILITNFISIAIENAILPPLSTAFNNNENDTINRIVSKALFWCFIPGAIASFIFFNYSNELMMLFYHTDKGSLYLKIMAIPSFIAYFEGVFVSLLIATNNEKKLVINTIITNLLYLLLIILLVSNPLLNAMGLVISFSITLMISTSILLYLSIKHTPLKLNYKHIILAIISYIILMSISFLL